MQLIKILIKKYFRCELCFKHAIMSEEDAAPRTLSQKIEIVGNTSPIDRPHGESQTFKKRTNGSCYICSTTCFSIFALLA